MKYYQFEKMTITINQRKAGDGGTIIFCHGNKTYNYNVDKFTITLPPDNSIFYAIDADGVQPATVADNLTSHNSWLNTPTYYTATWLLNDSDIFNNNLFRHNLENAKQLNPTRLSDVLKWEMANAIKTATNAMVDCGDLKQQYSRIFGELLLDACEQIDFKSIANSLKQMADANNTTWVEQIANTPTTEQ